MNEHIITFFDSQQNLSRFDGRISKATVDAIGDFVFGYGCATGVTDLPLEEFRHWLGVELGIFKPLFEWDGIWRGDSLDWQRMLLRHYGSEVAAYGGFFYQYSVYRRRLRTFIKRFEFHPPITITELIVDVHCGFRGFPLALVAYSIEGHTGVYVDQDFPNGTHEVLGYFSSIEEVEVAFGKATKF